MQSRRSFIKSTALTSAFMLGGVPLRSFGRNSKVSADFTNNKILVIVQLAGGNDILNFYPPARSTPERDAYVYRRPKIFLPSTGSRATIALGDSYPFSLHPDMIGLRKLWDEGKVAFIPSVGTNNPNGSHFRGRDIRAMGGGENDFYGSGWIGRYLQYELEKAGVFDKYSEDFPIEGEYDDPLALELGSVTSSLEFSVQGKLPASVAIQSPSNFLTIVDSVKGIEDNEEYADDLTESDKVGFPPLGIENTYPCYEDLMTWLIDTERDADKYSQTIVDVYDAGIAKRTGRKNAPTYPKKYPFVSNGSADNSNTRFSESLEIVSNLIEGGITTKVFKVTMPGFDTHDEQVESYNSTYGAHAAKAYMFSEAIKAFMDDLEDMGRADDVIIMTTTEFGRKIYENGYGTDHGDASMELVIGKPIQNPLETMDDGASAAPTDSELEGNANLSVKIDYRRIYSTILKDWFGINDDNDVNGILDPNFGGSDEQSDIAEWKAGDKSYLKFLSGDTSTRTFKQQAFNQISMNAPYPNPVISNAIMDVHFPYAGIFTLSVYDRSGRLLKNMFTEKHMNEGNHSIEVLVSDLPTGNYMLSLSSDDFQKSVSLVKM